MAPGFARIPLGWRKVAIQLQYRGDKESSGRRMGMLGGYPTPILYMMAIREGSNFAWPTSYSPQGASWTWPKRGLLAGGTLAARRL